MVGWLQKGGVAFALLELSGGGTQAARNNIILRGIPWMK